MLIFPFLLRAETHFFRSGFTQRNTACEAWIEHTAICKYLDTNSVAYKRAEASPGMNEVKRRVKDGTYRIYFLQDTTKLAVEYVYSDSLLQSVKRYWFNGQLSYEGSYNAGKQVGEFYHYDKDGRKLHMRDYKRGVIWRGEDYYPNGVVKEKWHRDPKTGYFVWTYYYEDGIVKATGNKVSGYKTGAWAYYDEKGNLFDTKKHTAVLAP